MTNHPPMTAHTVRNLAHLLNLRDKSIKWLRTPDADTPFAGVLREVGPYDGNVHTGSTDIRDHYARLSGVVEMWVPVADLLSAIDESRFFPAPQ